MGCCASTEALLAAPSANGHQLLEDVEQRIVAHAAAAQKKLPKASPTSAWARLGGSALEPLLAHTTLVCIRYLLSLAHAGLVLPAHQALPASVKVSLAKLRASGSGEFDGLPVLVLSYPWYDVHHPDATGEQLRSLTPLLEAVVAKLRPNETWGVLWDFASLPQRGYSACVGTYTPHTADDDRFAEVAPGRWDDRSVEERARFRLGLRSINAWYAHQRTWVLLVNCDLGASAQNRHEYDGRGWVRTAERGTQHGTMCVCVVPDARGSVCSACLSGR
jgi:hypothetical protein